MSLSYIAGSGAESNTITIPGSYQAGDLIIIFAFRDGSTTSPTIPSGWITLSTGSITGAAIALGYKLATSSSDISGTWTNATELVCVIYRGYATNKTPLGVVSVSSGTSTTVNYAAISPMKCPGTSWILAFCGHVSTDTSLETPPTSMVNRVDQAGVTAEAVAHDTNGVIAVWPSTSVSVGGTSGAWISRTVELFSEQLGPINNYQFIKDNVGGTDSGILGFTEKIK